MAALIAVLGFAVAATAASIVCADNEACWGTDQADQIRGTPGADRIHPLDGDDETFARAGNDHVYGSDGEDASEGGRGADYLLGLMGADSISGGPGPDFVRGGLGNDRLVISTTGRSGPRRPVPGLAGGTARDELLGGRGRDFLRGDGGKDRLLGGPDNDWLDARTGDTPGDPDAVSCGAGFDTYAVSPDDEVAPDCEKKVPRHDLGR